MAINYAIQELIFAQMTPFTNKAISYCNTLSVPATLPSNVTGISFTSPENLRRYCGIDKHLHNSTELSSRFTYQVIETVSHQTQTFSKIGALVSTFLLLFSMTIAASGQSLADSVNAYLHQLPTEAHVSIFVKSLTNKRIAFAHRADERVPSASVIKLPIMLEMMERVKAGQLNLDEVYTLQPTDKVGGSGVLQNYADQSPLTYRELLRLMMTESDNTATNIIINRLGRETINQRIRTIGLKQSQLNRIMMDTLAAKQGRENYVTAQEMSTLLEKIYRHQVATPQLCEEMITVLKQVPGTLTFNRLLPKDVAVAHKTGMLAYVRGDAGIIYAKEPFLLSVFVEGVPTPEAERIISELALRCYNYFSHK